MSAFVANFVAKRVTRTYTQHILAAPNAVFPLLCPVREAEWLDGWDYKLIYSTSGYAEEGCVFTSKQTDEPDTIWLTTEHDEQSHRVEFARVTPESRVAKVNISLRANPDETTSADISYTITALNETGNEFVDGYTEQSFVQGMQWWEKSMNHFLKTGEKLRLP